MSSAENPAVAGPEYDAGDWESTLETEIEYVDPEQLLAHPANARTHPGGQRAAIRTVLNEVGWLAPVIVNRTTERILDGHMRVEEAISRKSTIPVAYVTVPEEQEAYVLATFDPVAFLAGINVEAKAALLEQVGSTRVQELDGLLADLAQRPSEFNQGSNYREWAGDLGGSDALVATHGSERPAGYSPVAYPIPDDKKSVVARWLKHVAVDNGLATSAAALVHLAEEWEEQR